MPNRGSFNLEFTEEFDLSERSHEAVADELAERVRQKLTDWGVVRS
jgi:hypothetical protein